MTTQETITQLVAHVGATDLNLSFSHDAVRFTLDQPDDCLMLIGSFPLHFAAQVLRLVPEGAGALAVAAAFSAWELGFSDALQAVDLEAEGVVEIVF
jgi:hypothetical protein